MTHLALHVRDLEACIAFYARHCNMRIVHERPKESAGRRSRIVWMAEPGRERDFIFVLLPGGPGRDQSESDFSHLGFALDSRAAVDAAADRGRADGCLVWEPREEAYPVGYYCGLRDPDGNYVEFSFGQPLGPGAERHDAGLLAGSADGSA
jgi:catechol 2,3-dioxygenase-like lactoylglutathione lyase family enzyme